MKGVTFLLLTTLAVTSAATGEVCEELTPAECGLRGNCSLCKNKFGGPDLCFSDKVTKKLPAQVFDCTAGQPLPALSLYKKPKSPCHGLNATECSLHATNCTLCEMTFTGSQICFNKTVAAKLPPQIFKCPVEPAPEPPMLGPNPIPEICEMLNATECALHAANCSLCKQSFTGIEMCFRNKIAAKLPPQFFNCTPAPEPAPVKAAALEAKPIPEICNMYNATECALHTANCTLCKDAFTGKQICFNSTIAAKLPPQIFQCPMEPAPEPALLTPNPIPEICEMYNATECALHAANCSLCKQSFSGVAMCFRNKIAAKLPPQFFNCTPAPEPAPVKAAAFEAKPIPEICSMYNATECALHTANCTLCKNAFTGKQICFNSTIAAKLPPQIFTCGAEPKHSKEAVGAAAGAAPLEVCEMFTPAQCMLHADTCSLCKHKFAGTQLCFSPAVAAKLPPLAALSLPLPPFVAELRLQVPPDSHHNQLGVLPTEIFACGATPAADDTFNSLASATSDNHDMCYVQDEVGCGATSGCVWCLSNKAPSGCYLQDKARRLPGSLFQCQFPTLLTASRKLLEQA
ncbi:hypothetical protein N2152v2_005832 [Parachlorella kessleri]